MVVGGPVLLLRLGADPLPERLAGPPELVALLTSPDDGTLLVWALSVAGWVAWAVVASSLLLELGARLTGRRTLRVPGLAVPQRLAQVAVAGVLAALAVPGAGHAHPLHTGHPPVVAVAAAGVVVDGTAGPDRHGPPEPAGEVPGTGPERLTYQVAEEDWMWHISGRYLGDELRYPEIAALNPGYAERHAGFPDHIEPGDRLVLPEDAHDRGVRGHATGEPPAAPGPGTGREVTPGQPAPDQPAEPGRPQDLPAPDQPAPDQPEDRPQDQAAEPGPAPPTPGGPAPALRPAVPAPPPSGPAGTAHGPPSAGAGKGAPPPGTAALLAAAAAAGALVVALVLHRRRGGAGAGAIRTGTRQDGRHVVDARRLDHALRVLAAVRAGRDAGTAGFPDLAAVWISGGDIHLILATPDPDPPAPFRRAGPDRWVLPAGAALAGVPALAAPLPALVTVGHRPGRQLLLDLGRIGPLTVTGDPDRARDLLRHVVAELTHNPWSDRVEVVLAGYPPEPAAALAALAPGRITVVTPAEAAARLRRTGTPGPVPDPEAPSAGPAGGAPGGEPAARVLVAELTGDREPDRDLHTALAAGHRGAAAILTGPDPPPGRRSITVTGDGQLRVGFLDGLPAVPAVALPEHLLGRLAGLVHGGPHRTGAAIRCA
jgi:hypothetical protein